MNSINAASPDPVSSLDPPVISAYVSMSPLDQPLWVPLESALAKDVGGTSLQMIEKNYGHLVAGSARERLAAVTML